MILRFGCLHYEKEQGSFLSSVKKNRSWIQSIYLSEKYILMKYKMEVEKMEDKADIHQSHKERRIKEIREGEKLFKSRRKKK